MASILKVDALQGITSAGDITVTSEGGAATQSLQQGLAKGFCMFDQRGDFTSVNDIVNSLNISSVTDNAAAQAIFVHTNLFSSDEAFTPVSTGHYNAGGGKNSTSNSNNARYTGANKFTTSGFMATTLVANNSSQDGVHYMATFGDLA